MVVEANYSLLHRLQSGLETLGCSGHLLPVFFVFLLEFDWILRMWLLDKDGILSLSLSCSTARCNKWMLCLTAGSLT